MTNKKNEKDNTTKKSEQTKLESTPKKRGRPKKIKEKLSNDIIEQVKSIDENTPVVEKISKGIKNITPDSNIDDVVEFIKQRKIETNQQNTGKRAIVIDSFGTDFDQKLVYTYKGNIYDTIQEILDIYKDEIEFKIGIAYQKNITHSWSNEAQLMKFIRRLVTIRININGKFVTNRSQISKYYSWTKGVIDNIDDVIDFKKSHIDEIKLYGIIQNYPRLQLQEILNEFLKSKYNIDNLIEIKTLPGYLKIERQFGRWADATIRRNYPIICNDVQISIFENKFGNREN